MHLDQLRLYLSSCHFGCGRGPRCGSPSAVTAPVIAQDCPGAARVPALARQAVWRDIGAAAGPLAGGLLFPVLPAPIIYAGAALLFAPASLGLARPTTRASWITGNFDAFCRGNNGKGAPCTSTHLWLAAGRAAACRNRHRSELAGLSRPMPQHLQLCASLAGRRATSEEACSGRQGGANPQPHGQDGAHSFAASQVSAVPGMSQGPSTVW